MLSVCLPIRSQQRRWVGVSKRGSVWLALSALVAFSLVWWWLGEAGVNSVAGALAAGVRQLGVWAPVAWVVAFALLAAFFFPVAILSVASGALFGVGWGTLLTLLGATGAATLSMWLGRRWLAARVEAHLGPRAEVMRRRVDAEGWRFVAFTRVVPLLPFALLNFSFGLTHIRIIPYALTTFAFMLPARWAYAYAGEVGWVVFQQQFEAYRPWLVALGLLLTLMYGWRLLRPRAHSS